MINKYEDNRSPFEIYLLNDYSIKSMVPLASSLIKHPKRDVMKGIFFEPEESRIYNLLEKPLKRSLEEVGQNNIVLRYGKQNDIPIYLLASSNLENELTFLMRQTDLEQGDYLGIFHKKSINIVKDCIKYWRQNVSRIH